MSNEFFREERNALVEKGFEKAQALITRDAIDPKRFINLYGKENVERDLRYVADNEEAWNAARAKESPETIEKMKRATVLEAILHEHGELSEWFGGKVTMIKTSRFDDINRGVDSIAEFEGKDGYSFLAMAIDATASQHVGGKIAHIAAKIKGGHLASVKYFGWMSFFIAIRITNQYEFTNRRRLPEKLEIDKSPLSIASLVVFTKRRAADIIADAAARHEYKP